MFATITETKTGRTGELSRTQTAAAMLDLHGGGLNETQTAHAMEAMQRLRAGETITARGYQFTIIKD